MNKLMITTMVAAVAVAVNAQEFGANAVAIPEGTPAAAAAQELPPETGTGSAVAEMTQAQSEEVPRQPTAKEMIEDYFNSKEGWNKGYDEEADRIIVTDYIEFDVKNPKVSSDFIDERKERMTELLLKAKSKIIEMIMSKMSGSRILDVPGNPIAKQLEKENAEMNKALAAAKDDLAKLDANLADALARRDGVTPSELVAVISSWFTSAEKENIAEKFDADKKERYDNAKADFEAAAAKYKELAEKAEAMKGTIQKEMKTSLSRVSEMPIYGCTVLQQADSISEKNGRYKYQIAIVYSWSGEMMKAAGEILKGQAVKFNPGKKSMKEWIASKAQKGALSSWVGPRQYIDNQGNMWFLGIACSPVDDDSDANDANREMAELEAASEVMFSLYSDATSSKTLNKLTRVKVGANGEKETQVLKDYSKTQGESFKDIQISGNAELWSGILKHEPSGIDMNVVVYGVNSGSVKALKDIQTRSVALGIEVNTYQEQERGRQQALKQTFDASKTNPAARKEGAEKAKEEVKKVRSSWGSKPVNTFKSSVNKTQSSTTGTLKSGSQMVTEDED